MSGFKEDDVFLDAVDYDFLVPLNTIGTEPHPTSRCTRAYSVPLRQRRASGIGLEQSSTLVRIELQNQLPLARAASPLPQSLRDVTAQRTNLLFETTELLA